MAEFYPRVFLPNLSFRSLAVQLSSTPSGGVAETADGQAPSVRANLVDLDPSLRFVTAGTDGSRSYSWQVTASAPSDQPINAAASLFYFSSAQVFGITLRGAGGQVLDTLVQDRAAVSGRGSLMVSEAVGVRSVRSYRYLLSQPAGRRTVVGFVLPGLLEGLDADPFLSSERWANLPVVVDPFEAPVERGRYRRTSFTLRSAGRADVERLVLWAGAGSLLCEVERNVWRLGRLLITRIDRVGQREDVSFDFVERLLGRSF